MLSLLKNPKTYEKISKESKSKAKDYSNLYKQVKKRNAPKQVLQKVKSLKESYSEKGKEYGDKSKEIVKEKKKVSRNISRFVDKALKAKISNKRVLKKSEATMVIPSYKAESNFGDSSTFFKQEMEGTVKGLFFS